MKGEGERGSEGRTGRFRRRRVAGGGRSGVVGKEKGKPASWRVLGWPAAWLFQIGAGFFGLASACPAGGAGFSGVVGEFPAPAIGFSGWAGGVC